MTAVPPIEVAHQPAKERKRRPKFSCYPFLGVLLALFTAVLTYGGLFLLLVED
ncbi:hypothetical protein [Massilia agri]|uniref:Uncharacterized protein n=1 Tax=Massilia agri TaxID=1886785 RepID=A0ABT2AG71_9BURK|nr:hypothetical protein [Massilia agri]MCS0595237.1 hypothetical protein [Massilia agri]